VLARFPEMMDYLLNLPHPLVLLWLVWMALTPMQASHLLSRKNKPTALNKTGELLSFREVLAVGCVAGFVLLTFITAFCTWLTWKLAKVI
jgi:hypothetical protein